MSCGLGRLVSTTRRQSAARALLHDEIERLPVRVDHHVEVVVALARAVQGVGQRARLPRHVDVAAPTPYQRTSSRQKWLRAIERMRLAERDHALEEAEDVGVALARRSQSSQVVSLSWL